MSLVPEVPNMPHLLALDNPTPGYGPLALLVLIAIAFGVGNLILSALVGPSRKGATKQAPYESGMDPVGSTRRRFNVRFYILAMIFLVLDVEIVFLYPWVVTFAAVGYNRALALQFLVRMLFFVLTSAIAYAYAWRKGIFKYD